MTLASAARSHSILTFYVLTYAISWLGWVPAVAASSGVAAFAAPIWLAARSLRYTT